MVSTEPSSSKILNMSSTTEADFYVPEQYLGDNHSTYDIHIDNAIICQLHAVGSILSSGKLKSMIELSLGRRISSSTYSEHLKRLMKRDTE